MNNWIINAMPTLISVIQHLTEKGIELIGLDCKNDSFRIHCMTNEEFGLWAKIYNVQVEDVREGYTGTQSIIYPYKISAVIDGIMVFGLMGEEEFREWRVE